MRPRVDDEDATRVDAPQARERMPEPPPSDEELTIRQRPGRLPPGAQVTLTSRHDVDRRALPFTQPEGRRDEDEPLELAATVKAPSSDSLELDLLDDVSSGAPDPSSGDSPWSRFDVDPEALPSSLMPPPMTEPVDENTIRRARRATFVLWVAVAVVAVTTVVAMLWI